MAAGGGNASQLGPAGAALHGRSPSRDLLRPPRCYLGLEGMEWGSLFPLYSSGLVLKVILICRVEAPGLPQASLPCARCWLTGSLAALGVSLHTITSHPRCQLVASCMPCACWSSSWPQVLLTWPPRAPAGSLLLPPSFAGSVPLPFPAAAISISPSPCPHHPCSFLSASSLSSAPFITRTSALAGLPPPPPAPHGTEASSLNCSPVTFHRGRPQHRPLLPPFTVAAGANYGDFEAPRGGRLCVALAGVQGRALASPWIHIPLQRVRVAAGRGAPRRAARAPARTGASQGCLWLDSSIWEAGGGSLYKSCTGRPASAVSLSPSYPRQL